MPKPSSPVRTEDEKETTGEILIWGCVSPVLSGSDDDCLPPLTLPSPLHRPRKKGEPTEPPAPPKPSPPPPPSTPALAFLAEGSDPPPVPPDLTFLLEGGRRPPAPAYLRFLSEVAYEDIPTILWRVQQRPLQSFQNRLHGAADLLPRRLRGLKALVKAVQPLAALSDVELLRWVFHASEGSELCTLLLTRDACLLFSEELAAFGMEGKLTDFFCAARKSVPTSLLPADAPPLVQEFFHLTYVNLPSIQWILEGQSMQGFRKSLDLAADQLPDELVELKDLVASAPSASALTNVELLGQVIRCAPRSQLCDMLLTRDAYLLLALDIADSPKDFVNGKIVMTLGASHRPYHAPLLRHLNPESPTHAAILRKRQLNILKDLHNCRHSQWMDAIREDHQAFFELLRADPDVMGGRQGWIKTSMWEYVLKCCPRAFLMANADAFLSCECEPRLGLCYLEELGFAVHKLTTDELISQSKEMILGCVWGGEGEERRWHTIKKCSAVRWVWAFFKAGLNGAAKRLMKSLRQRILRSYASQFPSSAACVATSTHLVMRESWEAICMMKPSHLFRFLVRSDGSQVECRSKYELFKSMLPAGDEGSLSIRNLAMETPSKPWEWNLHMLELMIGRDGLLFDSDHPNPRCVEVAMDLCKRVNNMRFMKELSVHVDPNLKSTQALFQRYVSKCLPRIAESLSSDLSNIWFCHPTYLPRRRVVTNELEYAMCTKCPKMLAIALTVLESKDELERAVDYVLRASHVCSWVADVVLAMDPGNMFDCRWKSIKPYPDSPLQSGRDAVKELLARWRMSRTEKKEATAE